MWGQPAEGLHYRVNVHFVDDSYWDDGNRSTHRSHDYATLAEAVKSRNTFIDTGRYTAKSWVTGGQVTKGVGEDDVILWRWSGEKWLRVEADSVIDLLGEIA